MIICCHSHSYPLSQATINTLSVSNSFLFWIFYRNEIIQYVDFCIWLLSLELDAFEIHLCCSTLAWKIPWAEEPGGLQSMGSLRVRHDWATSFWLFTFMHWRRKWQPTPVFLPGGSQGLGSLMGCRLWGCTESDTTEATQQQQQHTHIYTHISYGFLWIYTQEWKC